MRTLWLLILMLAGCDQVFGLGSRPELPAADASTDTCVPPAIGDALDGPDPCRPWGYANGGAGLAPMTQSGGALRIAPEPMTKQFNGCTAAVPITFGVSGVFTEISSVLSYEAANTGFKFYGASPANSMTATINVTQGRMYFLVGEQGVDMGDVAYEAISMRWWRLRPDRMAGTVVAETSPDGKDWTTLGAAPGVVPDTVVMELYANTYDDTAGDAGTAVYEQINLCPN